MTPCEFKAWFEGFTEACGSGVPSSKQWEKIKARVVEIDGKPVTERVFLERYWPPYQPYAQPHWAPYHLPTTWAQNANSCGGLTNPPADYSSLNVGGGFSGAEAIYNSSYAMSALGAADAAMLNN